MGNKKKFVNESFWWIIGTIIGNALSIIGIVNDSKIVSIIGVAIAAIATVYYGYKCWKETLWEEIQ